MRTVSWFSCGAASAVATKLALTEGPVTIAYCEVKEEHPDNKRFLKDCEEWFGQEIEILGNDDYERSIYSVFEKTRFLVGPGGARCTKELKKTVRERFELPTDRQVFGYTVEEQDRFDRFVDANTDVDAWPILIERGLDKSDCIAMVERAGIELPAMYKLGYKNNNCMGCVKASSPEYWRKIEQDFPAMFNRMNNTERHLGRAVCKIDMLTVSKRYPDIYKTLGSPDHKGGGKVYWRPQLHELPDDIIAMDNAPDIQCGIFCHMAEHEYA
jgi:hypothetical protein